MPMFFRHLHEKPFNFDKPAHFKKLLNDLGSERNKALHDEKRLLEAYLLRDEIEHLHGRPLRRRYPDGELPLLPFGESHMAVLREKARSGHNEKKTNPFS